MYIFARRVANQLKKILPLQRVAASENENWNVHVGDLINERLAFLVRQLIGMRNGLRRRAAVFARQVAGLRDLPDCEKRRFVVVDLASCAKCASATRLPTPTARL